MDTGTQDIQPQPARVVFHSDGIVPSIKGKIYGYVVPTGCGDSVRVGRNQDTCNGYARVDLNEA